MLIAQRVCTSQEVEVEVEEGGVVLTKLESKDLCSESSIMG